MKKNLKIFLWTLLTISTVAIISWNVLLQMVSEAFGTQCSINKSWEIENYKIVKKQCIGYAGPSFYPVYLYDEEGVEIDKLNFNRDSCLIQFTTQKGDTLKFDLCLNAFIR